MANNPAAAAAAPHNDDGPRNLVICLDGTANQFSAKNTNVVKLFGVLDISERQLAYYDSGVGTYLPVGASSTWTEARQSIAQGLDLALAWNFDDHVKNAYSWLMNYYQAGDRIYLFGFSRGAYAARALVGMVERIGLLPAGNQSQVALAYDVYKSPEFVKKQGNLPRFKDTELATKYRGTFGISREVDFHFVGVWDTVSSLGGLDAPNLPFANTHLPQALNVWVGPNGMLPYDVAPGLVSAIRRQFDPVHRRRIVYLAADHDTSTPIIRPAPPGPQTDDRAQGKTESLKGIGYRALEYWRFTWTWYEMRDDAWVPIKGRAMHRGDGRYIREDQQLHRSVQRRLAYDHAIGLGDVAARPMGFETYPAIQAHLPPTWFAGANPWSAVRYAAMPGLWEDTEPLPPGLQ